MARNLKPAEKRRMREQLAETERDIARLKERAQKFAGSWIGRDALNKARDAEESAQRLRMYVQPNVGAKATTAAQMNDPERHNLSAAVGRP